MPIEETSDDHVWQVVHTEVYTQVFEAGVFEEMVARESYRLEQTQKRENSRSMVASWSGSMVTCWPLASLLALDGCMLVGPLAGASADNGRTGGPLQVSKEVLTDEQQQSFSLVAL